MSIIISKPGAETKRIDPIAIPQETMLQEYIQEHPEVLPMTEIREGSQFIVLVRSSPQRAFHMVSQEEP